VSPRPSASESESLAAAIASAALGDYRLAVTTADLLTHSALASSAHALIASCYRQLGEHQVAASVDRAGLLSDQPDIVGRADCATGWAADLIGSAPHSASLAADLAQRLELAERCTAAASGEPESWRLQVRLLWVRAEAALVLGAAAEALGYAVRATELSNGSESSRHQAKSLLVQGVASAVSADAASAHRCLTQAAALADANALAPLQVPVHGLLARQAADGRSTEHYLAAAAAADFIADHLPPGCEGWRSRPDVAALTRAD
jgi:hypothetical protein